MSLEVNVLGSSSTLSVNVGTNDIASLSLSINTSVNLAQSSATTATTQASNAQTSAANALSSANAAGAQIYPTAAAGVAAVALNAIFYVPLNPSGGLDIRQKNGAGTSVSIGQFLPPTQTNADITPGRLLKVGDYGLGADGAILHSNWNSATVNGALYMASDAANAPASGWWIGTYYRHNNLFGTQTVWQFTATQAIGWVRNQTSGIWRAWSRILTSGEIVQSARDAAVGRIVRVGDHGIGRTTDSFSGDIDTINTNGSFRLTAGAFSTASPTPLLGAGQTLVHNDWNVDGAHQTLRLFTNPVRVFERIKFGGVWRPWQEVFNAATLLGAVSQSGGVPTGRLIERGSNANGRFTRFADGTQTCWRTLTASAAAGVVWTFPVPFSVAPVVTGNVVAAILVGVVLDADPSATTVTLSARGTDNNRRANRMHITASGDWF